MHARPGFLRAGVEAVAAGEKRQRMDIAAEIGPLAGAELAVDADEQRDRRVKELEIAFVLGEPPRRIIARNAERAVKLHAVLVAAGFVRLPYGFGIDRIFGVVVARIAAIDERSNLPLDLGERRAGQRVNVPGLQVA